MSVIANPVLEQLPGSIELGGLELLSIENNPELRTVPRYSGTAVIYQALTTLDLGGLRSVDELEIRDNASLSQLVPGGLERVDDLQVVNNPQLSTAVFDAVQTFTRDLSGNLPGAGAAP